MREYLAQIQTFLNVDLRSKSLECLVGPSRLLLLPQIMTL